jgi:hypothetical protein
MEQIIQLPSAIPHHLQQPEEYVLVLFVLFCCPLQHFLPTPELLLQSKINFYEQNILKYHLITPAVNS